jgi:tetratricopeptide (TPR) repeat protein
MKSLLRILKKEYQLLSDPIEKAKKANEISRAFLYRDLDQVREYAHKALSLLNDTNTTEICKAYLNLGAACFLSQDLEGGIFYYHKVYLQNPSEELLMRCHMGVGVCFLKLHFYQEALYHEEKALDLALKIGHSGGLAGIYTNIATVHMHLESYELADCFFSKALKIAKSNAYGNIQGYIFVGLLNNDLKQKNMNAIENHFLEIETLIDGENEMWYIGITQSFKACYYIHLDNIDMADIYFKIGMDILEAEEQYLYLVLAFDEYINSLISKHYYQEAKEQLHTFGNVIDKYKLDLGRPKFLKTAMIYYNTVGDIPNYHKYQQEYEDFRSVTKKMLDRYF